MHYHLRELEVIPQHVIVDRPTGAPLARMATQVEIEVARVANHIVHHGAREHVHGAALCVPSGAPHRHVALSLLLLLQLQQVGRRESTPAEWFRGVLDTLLAAHSEEPSVVPFLHDHEGEERAIWWRGGMSELRGSGFDCLHLPLEDPGELALAHSVPVENDDLRVRPCIQRNIIIFVSWDKWNQVVRKNVQGYQVPEQKSGCGLSKVHAVEPKEDQLQEGETTSTWSTKPRIGVRMFRVILEFDLYMTCTTVFILVHDTLMKLHNVLWTQSNAVESCACGGDQSGREKKCNISHTSGHTRQRC